MQKRGQVDLEQIERELKKRWAHPYVWPKKQDDAWDEQTDFIYQISKYDELERAIAGYGEELKNYARNRWYNFWSAVAVEQIFGMHKAVKPHPDPKDRYVDFTIGKIPFDLKTSVYPQKYPRPIHEALNTKPELIRWLYRHQSRQRRHHLKNRLFIILYAADGEHWRLKARIFLLKHRIDAYLDNLHPSVAGLYRFKTEDGGSFFSDIIWVIDGLGRGSG